MLRTSLRDPNDSARLGLLFLWLVHCHNWFAGGLAPDHVELGEGVESFVIGRTMDGTMDESSDNFAECGLNV